MNRKPNQGLPTSQAGTPTGENPSDKPLVLYQAGAARPAALRRIDETLRRIPGIDPRPIENAKAALAEVTAASTGVALFYMRTIEDLSGVLTFLLTHKEKIRSKLLVVFVFNKIPQPRVPDVLKAKGCAEVLNFALNSRALFYKVHQALDDIASMSLMEQGQGKRKSPSELGTVPQASPSQKVAGEIQMTAPLELASDCWLLERKGDIRYVQGRWLIEMIGPGPSSGSWKAASKTDGGNENVAWEWVPRNPTQDPFIKDLGRWIYSGRQPEFIWETNRWRFVGKAPFLGFYHKDGNRTFRLALKKAGLLELAENSEVARAKLPLIKETFDSSLRVKNDPRKEGGSDLALEKGKKEEIKWNDRITDSEKAKDWRQHDPQAPSQGASELKRNAERVDQQEFAMRRPDSRSTGTGQAPDILTSRGRELERKQQQQQQQQQSQEQGQGQGQKKKRELDQKQALQQKQKQEDVQKQKQEQLQKQKQKRVHERERVQENEAKAASASRANPSSIQKKNLDQRKDRPDRDSQADWESLTKETGANEPNAPEAEGKAPSSTKWGRVDLKRDRLASGRGIGLGQPGDQKSYKPKTPQSGSLEPESQDDDPARSHSLWKTGAAAFESMKIRVAIQSLNGLQDDGIHVIDFGDAEVTLDVPGRELQVQQQVRLRLKLDDGGRALNVDLGGVIETSEPQEDGRQIILVRASEDGRDKVQEELRRIQQAVARRQTQISRFLREAKGV